MARAPQLPRICIALGFPKVETLLAHARQEAGNGENFLEFRLDYLSKADEGIEAIAQFKAEYPECTILATCRRHQNDGRFQGSVEEELEILRRAVEAGAAAVDIELQSAESHAEALGQFFGKACVIISYHNFHGTPSLSGVLKRMTRLPADGYKIVTTAKKPSDCWRVLGLAKSNPRLPLILLAMGEIGFPTRVLSPAYGGMYTYAAPKSAEGTAAGQVCARQLRGLYQVEKLTAATKVYGVIADPVSHSISPAVHNRAFKARRLNATYLPFLVPAGQLRDFFSLAEKLPLAGLSVTIPHKQKVIRFLDVIDPLSRRIGAVNTVWRKAGKWRGTNTDVDGVLKPLEKRLRLARASILIAGTGGAARGAAFALSDRGAKVTITGRNPDRARALAKACNGRAAGVEEALQGHYDALIHATPLGMYPHPERCFFDERIPADLVFDMVYNPEETRLVQMARAAGKEVITGTEMFLEQAARQFEIWTGESAPRAAMLRAAKESLAQFTPPRISHATP